MCRIILLYIFCLPLFVVAQNITANDGFEGERRMGQPPNYWSNCNDGVSTVDTQPGYFKNKLSPSEGFSYISMVTRAVGSNSGTVESVHAALLTPFEKGVCYTFQLDLSLSDTFEGTLSFETYSFNNPSVLQVFGFNGDCNTPSEVELLFESTLIDHVGWKTYLIEFTPELNSYTHLKMRPFFSPPNELKNAALLVDNIQPVLNNEYLSINEGLLELSPIADDIQWFFNNEPVENANTHIMPIRGTGFYTVSFYTPDRCLRQARYFLHINYAEVFIFPNPTADKLNVKFLSEEDGFIEYFIHNELGQIVLHEKQFVYAGKNSTIMDISSLASGVYFVRLNRKKISSKLIKIVKL